MFTRGVAYWLGFTTGIMVAIVLIAHAPRCNAGEPAAKIKTAIVRPPPVEDCVDETLHEAAMFGLAEARRLTVDTGWEWVSGVYRQEATGKLCVALPATSEHPRSVWHFTVMPKGYTFVAILHTHPGTDPYSSVFSGVDANTACTLGVPSFIVTDARAAFRFMPGPVTCAVIRRDRPNIFPGLFIGMVQP